jgi:plastocyanin
LLFPIAALLGAAVAVLPALAASSEARIEVAESCNHYSNWQCWTAPGANPKPAFVTITAGGVVTFVDKTGFAANIAWKGAAPNCSGVPVSPTPAATGWEGTCTFEQPGKYVLETASMYYPQATVEVSAGTTPTGTSTTGTTMTSSTTTGSGSGSSTQAGGQTGTSTPSGSLLAGSESQALKLGATQHGGSVHGAVDISQAGAGGRLEVELLSSRASLAGAGRASHVRVGRIVRMLPYAGITRFTVPLDAAARRALRAHGRLALSVEIVLTAPHGTPLTLTRSVVLRS